VLATRGEEFIAAGDIAGARLVLQRAAEARDAGAALLLGATYDPIMLEKFRVRGFAPDIATARTWYERAKEFGSAEASRRLEMLASPQPPSSEQLGRGKMERQETGRR
jgi:TPR repeat protein